MLVVNFGGGFAAVPAVLKHHHTWCSVADLVMPQFFFAVGFALRLTLLRNVETLGAAWAWRRVLRRIGLLLVVGLVFHNLHGQWLDVARVDGPTLASLLARSFWRDSFQTLVHIALTSLWVLPVVLRPLRVRCLFGLGSAALHVLALAAGWYDVLQEKRVIDGGPLGFLTWTLPVIAGTAAHDWWRALGPRGTLRPLLGWGAALMAGGYALSCLSAGGSLAAPPLFPPHGPVDMWTMSQRSGSVSYLAFAAGFALVLQAGFVAWSDVRGGKWSLFTVFGQNALAAYLLHDVLGHPFATLRAEDAPSWQAATVIALFVAVNALIVAWLNRRRWFLRL